MYAEVKRKEPGTRAVASYGERGKGKGEGVPSYL